MAIRGANDLRFQTDSTKDRQCLKGKGKLCVMATQLTLFSTYAYLSNEDGLDVDKLLDAKMG